MLSNNIQDFCFLFSCIPLYNFHYTYNYIMSTSTSFVDRLVGQAYLLTICSLLSIDLFFFIIMFGRIWSPTIFRQRMKLQPFCCIDHSWILQQKRECCVEKDFRLYICYEQLVRWMLFVGSPRYLLVCFKTVEE